jgi:beta-lactamase class A
VTSTKLLGRTTTTNFTRAQNLPPNWMRLAGVHLIRTLAVLFVLMNHPGIHLLLAKVPLPAQSTLEDKWGIIAAHASGRVGAAAVVIETGESAARNGSGHFPMQSVYKLPIVMALLHAVDEGKFSLDQIVDIQTNEYVPSDTHSTLRDQFPSGARKTVRDLIRYTLVESDGSASDVLLRLAGGPQAVTLYIRSLGISDLVVANSEKEMSWKTQYADWCTPQAALQLLVTLEKGPAISESSRALILKYMEEAETGTNRIRHFLPKGAPVADKTGTSGTRHGRTAATNDIGLVSLPDGRHLAIAIFVTDSKSSDEVREGVIAKTARAAWDEWVPAK